MSEQHYASYEDWKQALIKNEHGPYQIKTNAVGKLIAVAMGKIVGIFDKETNLGLISESALAEVKKLRIFESDRRVVEQDEVVNKANKLINKYVVTEMAVRHLKREKGIL